MPVRVVVVDDSRFFRRRVCEMLNGDKFIEVVGTAVNGLEAIEMVKQLKPDVVTMDIEMPVMDGITAVRKIMQQQPTPILMFSSLTTEGAQATLNALEAGAVDFLPKKFEDISQDIEHARRTLCTRVRGIGARRFRRSGATSSGGIVTKPRADPPPRRNIPTSGGATVLPLRRRSLRHQIAMVAIGTSTGGPVALQNILTKLPREFPVPILLIQHMPATFTTAFAARLDKQSQISVREARDGDQLVPGLALLAPGGKQMTVEKRGSVAVVRVSDAQAGHTYKPSVDITFRSLAEVFPGQVLAAVLTGMGADGREGAKLLKEGGATIWAQDENSSVVFGMPAAVIEAGVVDQVLPLDDIGLRLAQEV